MTQSSEIASRMAGATNWALWKCDEASGNLADSSGNGFTLIARGTPAYSQSGIEDTAISFDGSADEGATAIIQPIGSPLGNNWTIGLNVKGSAQASKCLFSMTAGTTSGAISVLTGTSAGTNDDQVRVHIQTASNSNVVLSVVTGTILDGAWHHLVLVGSGGNTVTPYIDGIAGTPISGAWSASPPVITNAAIACQVTNDSFPSLPTLETAITVDNVFCGDIALSEQDVIDIYNAGSPDTTAPVLSSAVVASDGLSVILTFTEIGSLPLLPASGITGFSLTRNAVSVSLSSVVRTDNAEITITPSAAIQPGDVLLNYSGGNVEDTAGNDLATIVDFVCTNNSVTATYAQITMLASVSSRMAPHTVWVTAAEESVPINGDWRYCSAEWDFGDGSTFTVENPINGGLMNATTDQSSWACASHTYEAAGDYTITLTLTGSDGVESEDTQAVTVVADTRTVKYLNSAAAGGGDGTVSTPWNTHAAMMAGVTSATKVVMSGTFNLTTASPVPAVSNVWFAADAGGVTFNWSSNPVTDVSVFEIPETAENILIDGRISGYTSRGIVVTSDVAKSTTKNDNQTAFVNALGNGVKARNCTVAGDIASGGVCGLAMYGGSSSTSPEGLTAENCDFGDCNNYLSVFTNMSYVNWLGVTAGTAWIEHTQRWLDPNWSKYIAHQWSEFDHKRILGGTTAGSGAGAKDCIRFQAVKFATVHDTILSRGVLDISYHTGSAATGEYGPGHHIQYSRCIIDDSQIMLRPACSDVSFVNCYLKTCNIATDTATPEAGDKVLSDVSILHNTFADPSGSFGFIDVSVATGVLHSFTKSGIEVDGNLFCTTTGQSGTFLRVDDATLYTVFDSVADNVFTDSLSVYASTKNAATQAITASQNWTTFSGEWPDNSRETIEATDFDGFADYRPDVATYPVTSAAAAYRSEGCLRKDLQGVTRPTFGSWYAGAVGATNSALVYYVLRYGGNALILAT